MLRLTPLRYPVIVAPRFLLKIKVRKEAYKGYSRFNCKIRFSKAVEKYLSFSSNWIKYFLNSFINPFLPCQG